MSTHFKKQKIKIFAKKLKMAIVEKIRFI